MGSNVPREKINETELSPGPGNVSVA